MAQLKLFIGNKNYSSWSFRPWLAMTVAGVSFDEEVLPLDFAGGNKAVKAISESGKVPVLQHGGLKIWESLAIIEYVAELYPNRRFWPDGMEKRALARAVSAEMASGFFALRGNCHMNFHRAPSKLDVDAATKADITRVDHIWKTLLNAHGGPFLFGDFCAADAMFAPVVNRFTVYGLTPSSEAEAYMNAMKALPAWKAWEAAALRETWVVPESEI